MLLPPAFLLTSIFHCLKAYWAQFDPHVSLIRAEHFPPRVLIRPQTIYYVGGFGK